MFALVGFQRFHGARAEGTVNGDAVAFFFQRGLDGFDGFAVHGVVTQHAFPADLRVGNFFVFGDFCVFSRDFFLDLLCFFHQFLDFDRLVFGRNFHFTRGFFADQFLFLDGLEFGFNLGRIDAGFFLHDLLGDARHFCRDFHHTQCFAGGGEGTRRAFAAGGHVSRLGDDFFFDFVILRRDDFLIGHRRFDFDLFFDGFKDSRDDFQFFAGRFDDDLFFRHFIFGRDDFIGLGRVFNDNLLGARLELGRDNHQRLTFAGFDLRDGQRHAFGSGRGGSFALGLGVFLCLRQGGDGDRSQQHGKLTFHHSKSPN